MDVETTNFLYRDPKLYDSVFRSGDTGIRLKRLCYELLLRNGKEPPSTVLDIGCGTGFKLAYLHEHGYECVGIDPLETMISYARDEYPGVGFQVGDIRSVRMPRKFDVITCLGWVIENVHSCADVSRAMATFAAHATPGTLLVFDTHNPIGDLYARGSRHEFSVDLDGFTATAQASFSVDRRDQILTRTRKWSLPDGAEEEDCAQFRLFFPMELEQYLTLHGFTDIHMYDNTDLTPTTLEGSMLHITAVYEGKDRN